MFAGGGRRVRQPVRRANGLYRCVIAAAAVDMEMCME
jgi:hypothetical protein